ncbi:MAG: hypothetical protein ACTSU2_10715 [Promethearchaeota archaeon]
MSGALNNNTEMDESRTSSNKKDNGENNKKNKNINEQINDISKKVKTELIKTGEKLKIFGKDLKTKIEEKVKELKNSNVVFKPRKLTGREEKNKEEGNIEEDYDLEIAYCGNCGAELSPELTKRLLNGQSVICEQCGIELKIDFK